MGFSVYFLAFYFEFNKHKTDTQNKSCQQNICREETVIIWFTFKPGLELTSFRTTWLCFQQVDDMSPQFNLKPALGQWSTLIKHMASMSYKLEPVIWSHDTGQQIA